jgi:hypothetical protein
MSDDKKLFVKPDVSAPLQKRSSYLKISEDEPLLVTVDVVEEIQLKTDVGIKEAVRVSCREVLIKKKGDEFSYTPDQETKIKESYSTSTWYLLKDYTSASHWPKEGIFYWVWKAEDGLRWEQA